MSAEESAQAERHLDWQTYPDLPLHPILAAALVHFQQRGYHGTTVREIAATVGQTMPTLYYHYGSKEGILSALISITMEDLQTHINACLEDAGVDTLKRFQNVNNAIASHYTQRRDLAMLHREFRFLSADLREKYLAMRAVVLQTLEDLINDGINEGIFDDADPHLTARVLLGMAGGILDWYRESGPLSAAEVAERYSAYAVRLVSKAAPEQPQTRRNASAAARPRSRPRRTS
jgi:AcrR family transcriptional regulator